MCTIMVFCCILQYFVAKSVFFCNLRCFVASSVLVRFTRFCVEKKLCPWRKNDKYEVCVEVQDRLTDKQGSTRNLS